MGGHFCSKMDRSNVMIPYNGWVVEPQNTHNSGYFSTKWLPVAIVVWIWNTFVCENRVRLRRAYLYERSQ